MTTRIAMDDHDAAIALARAIEAAGHEVALITTGESEAGAYSYLVATPASLGILGTLPEGARLLQDPAWGTPGLD